MRFTAVRDWRCSVSVPALTVDAAIAAEVFDPLHVVGEFRVAINLPWPFADIAVDINLESGTATDAAAVAPAAERDRS